MSKLTHTVRAGVIIIVSAVFHIIINLICVVRRQYEYIACLIIITWQACLSIFINIFFIGLYF